jgi:predicted PurR-regulated permease PerM
MVTPENPADEEPPPPAANRPRGSTIRSAAAAGLFVLAAFYTLYLGRSFFLPIVLALLLSFLLSPVVRFLRRLRLPNALGAGLVVLGLLGGLAWGVYELAGPAYEWAEKAPQTMRRLERKLREFKKPVQTMSRASGCSPRSPLWSRAAS